ncbi:cellulase [Sorangium cellulosum]|uniref:cellulase n=1 Tax=Sorangium cellulosum TaxID=56 RepID=A0A4P2Q4M7_SORCE|nr:cellulase family glycosylhydrolase [Sorangium cellulosum]AUX24337.1 cellulase [Sorangium cellulosum]
MMMRRSLIYPFSLCIAGLLSIGCGGDSSSGSGAGGAGSTGAEGSSGVGAGTPTSSGVGAGTPTGSGVGGGTPTGSGVGGGSPTGSGVGGGATTGSGSGSGGGTTNPNGDPTPDTDGSPDGIFRVDLNTGKLTHNGTPFQVRGGNWFGLEGQDDLERPGAMELFIGSMWWAESSAPRTIEDTMKELTSSNLKFNTIRLPIAPQTLVANHPDGNYSTTSPRIRNNNEEVYPYANAYEALEDFLKKADQNNLYVILGIHSCSNHLGWRAGRLDDAPPYVDSNRENYEYKADDYNCTQGEDAYSMEKWLADIRKMAQLPKKLNIDNIIGIDCFNEPWKYSWSKWADMAKACYDVIAEENDDMIAVVQGVSGSHQPEGASGLTLEPEPHGDENLNPNWGENFYGQKAYPIQIPRNRLCFSPHTYGPAVFVQKQHVDQSKPECVGLEDEEAAKAGCGLIVERSNADAVAKLRAQWDEHFGFLHDEKFCVITGEFGGVKDWPKNEMEPALAELWSHLPAGKRYDWEWQNIYVDYLIDKGMTDFTYWSINPESGDTGGLYNHKYTDADKSGWGTWEGLDTEKVEMLARLK